MTSMNRVGCPPHPAITLPATYRKKNFSKQFPKEFYLRSDLSCHTLICNKSTCQTTGANKISELGTDIEQVGYLNPDVDHYIIPSFHSLTRFHEIYARSKLMHCILLRTHMLQCTKSLERHMNSMLADAASQRRIVFFENEHHTATATKQRCGESVDQRHQRAERRAAKWYVKHLQGRKNIILIEEGEADIHPQTDSDGHQKSYPRESGGVIIHSMQSYLEWLQAQPRIVTSVSAATITSSSKPPKSSPSTDNDSEPTQLLRLYHSLLDSERAKLQQKAAQAQAAEQLESMLASLKLNWTRHTSEQEVKSASDDDMPPSGVNPLSRSSSLTSNSSATRSSMTLPPPPNPTNNELEYEEHLPTALALEAVSKGLLFRGHLHVNKYHAQHDASLDLGGRLIDPISGMMVDSSNSSSDTRGKLGEIFISGMVDRNRSIDGDEVVVQLLPPTLWKAPSTRKVLTVKEVDDSKTNGDDDEDDSDSNSSATVEDSRVVPTGRVVAIIQRNLRPFVATLQLDNLSGGDYSLVVPMNECIPKIRIRTHQVGALAQQRLLVKIDGWEVDSKYPSGVYLQSLGPIGSIETGIRCILHEHSISHPEFSVNMLKCLPDRPKLSEAIDPLYRVGSGYHSRGAVTPFSWTIPSAALVGRRDLRMTHKDSICSIDPIGCEDIDDALSCRDLPNGNVEVGVHIADVSYFVPQGSLLDQEAARRGTSVYLVDRRLDMLPAQLSSDLCSLRGGCDRLCISVLWEFNPSTGQVVSTWYGRTVIYNAFALSYEEAQYIYDTAGETKPVPTLPKDHPDYHLTLEERYDRAPHSSLTPQERVLLYPKIKSLLLLARNLREKRLEVGALELESLQIKFRLDQEKHVLGIQTEADLEVHSTIAEWMVFANCTVAYHIYQAFPSASLLRHHPYPAPSRFEKMNEMAKTLGLEIDTSSNKSLAESLKKAEEIISKKDFLTSKGSSAQLLKEVGDQALDSNQSKHWILKLLKELAARAMSEAQYFSTGSVGSVKEFFHYGLSADYYTHFTSPIRRYADLVVHRQLLQVIQKERREKETRKMEEKRLKAEIKGEAFVTISSTSSSSSSEEVLYTNDSLSKLAGYLNTKNRSAKIAGMESQDLFLACYLAGEERSTAESTLTATVSPSMQSTRPPRVERCEGLIVSLRANGFIILLPKYHVKGAVLLANRQGYANVAHPLELIFPPASTDEESMDQRSKPKMTIDYQESIQALTSTLSFDLPSPKSATPDLITPLPISHTFHVFDPIIVDVTLRPGLSRYRTPKPTFRLVWNTNEIGPKRNNTGIPQISSQSVGTASTASSSPAHTLVSPLSSGPQAPAGAKKTKPLNSTSSTRVGTNSLYELIRSGAVESSRRRSEQPQQPDQISTKVEREEKESTITQIGQGAKQQALQSRSNASRPRIRHSGALGGRLLFTPTGVIPTELLKTTIQGVTQTNGGGGEDEEY